MTTLTHELTRSVDGKTVPAVGKWEIDPAHTSVEFIGRHLMVSKVRGSFSDVSGTIDVAENPLESTVEVTVATASVSTGAADRDGHLKSPDFFDIENYPQMTFVSTAVRPDGDAWVLDGELTINGISNALSLEFEFLGLVDDPWGNPKAVFSGQTEIQRSDWNLNWNVALESGGVLVSKKITLELEVQASPVA